MLKCIHKAVLEWFTVSQSDTKSPCVYCSQFNSLAALELWRSKDED